MLVQNSYWQKLCRLMQSDMENPEKCENMMLQAANYCREVINQNLHKSFSIRDFLFPKTNTDIIFANKNNAKFRKYLKLEECPTLIVEILNDFAKNASRYAAELNDQKLQGIVLCSLVVIMLALAGIIFFQNIVSSKKPKQE